MTVQRIRYKLGFLHYLPFQKTTTGPHGQTNPTITFWTLWYRISDVRFDSREDLAFEQTQSLRPSKYKRKDRRPCHGHIQYTSSRLSHYNLFTSQLYRIDWVIMGCGSLTSFFIIWSNFLLFLLPSPNPILPLWPGPLLFESLEVS